MIFEAPGGRDLQGPANPFLAAHVAEVVAGDGGDQLRCRLNAGQQLRALEMLDHLAQVLGHQHPEVGDVGRLAGIGRGDDGAGEPELGGALEAGKHTTDGPEPAVEGQLADQRQVLRGVGGQQAEGEQDSDGDRQVEGAALGRLLRLDGDRDALVVDLDAELLQGGVNTEADLASVSFGQAMDLPRARRPADLGSNAHPTRFQTDQAEGEDFHEVAHDSPGLAAGAVGWRPRSPASRSATTLFSASRRWRRASCREKKRCFRLFARSWPAPKPSRMLARSVSNQRRTSSRSFQLRAGRASDGSVPCARWGASCT
jgi:hypothetical protein